MRNHSCSSRLLKIVSVATCESGRTVRSRDLRMGWVSWSLLPWCCFSWLEEYRKDVSEKWWSCPSLETKVAVTWQKSKAITDCGVSEPEVLLCWVFFIRYLCSLSFLPPAAPLAKGFIYVAQYLYHRSASARLGWHPRSFAGKCPHFPWPLELSSPLLRGGCLWGAEGTCARTGGSGQAGGAGRVFTLSTRWLQDAVITCYFQQF